MNSYHEDASVCGILHDLLLLISLVLVWKVYLLLYEMPFIRLSEGLYYFKISFLDSAITNKSGDTFIIIFLVITFIRSILYTAQLGMNIVLRVFIMALIVTVNSLVCILLTIILGEIAQNSFPMILMMSFLGYIVMCCPRGFMGLFRNF